jgi:hypothetical protein
MSPHAISDSINFRIGNIVSEGVTDILCSDAVSRQSLRHDPMQEPRMRISNPSNRPYRKTP